ncbi:aldo/keto reductase [Paeniglutamicibacter cryotolerans]|uniref:2,5-diketo-D-gluconate reductase A n=1 Tax=Paeniglutamicibacter cryotolerans TaxID=670079 RepID=A0A839QKI5_9MICC|nr:aldo/keto reductase [Paeniglutamicibacter cryotolerans]MBB2996908.1 2,5-diketo-D-gluconate reductase A [Paeniglutamicibacter cryotolerans]
MTTDLITSPLIRLANGASMPLLGFGTWPLSDAEAGAAVVHAIDAGYRMIDTAENYHNEEGIGLALARHDLARAELFVTTKFNKEWHSFQGVRDAWDHSATRLGVDYIDLMLIHWPNPEQGTYVQAWEGLVKLLKSGKVRAIGTSNFAPAQLSELIDATGVVPDVNQIQFSPQWFDKERLDFHAEAGIATQAWGSLGRGRSGLLAAAPVVEAAAAHGVTPAQAVLRWHVQHGVVPVAKTVDPQRMSENLDVFGFELDAGEMAGIDGLNGTAEDPVDPFGFGH